MGKVVDVLALEPSQHGIPQDAVVLDAVPTMAQFPPLEKHQIMTTLQGISCDMY